MKSALGALFLPRGLELPLRGLGLLAIALALLSLGLVILSSASLYRGEALHGDPTHFLAHQGVGVALGLIALVAASQVHPRWWLRAAPLLYGGVVGLLLLVLLTDLAVSRNSASRWIAFGPIQFQPSELAKPALPLLLVWFSLRLGSPGGARGVRRLLLVLPQALAVLLVSVLVAVEPDYGTAFFLLLIAAAVLILEGLPWSCLGAGGLLLSGPALYAFLERRELVIERFLALFDPEAIYQVRHSLFAIGSGGLLGKGFGLGVEKNLLLPAEYNDFIFAVYAEETGWLGVLILLGLFSGLLQCGFRIARECPSPPLRLLAFAFLFNILVQAIINIAVATASAPTKGISLPFISYGSSGLVVLLFEVGVLVAIARIRREGGPP